MPIPLRVLIVEDREADAELMLHALRHDGFDPSWQRVDIEQDFLAALDPPPDLILADWSLPQFSGVRALRLMHDRELEIPFLIVSGSIGEESAVEALRQGADDYMLKDRLARLGQAVLHALETRRLHEERLRMDVALRESEANLKEAQRLGQLGNWEYDLASQKLTWSDQTYELYERDPKMGPPTPEEEAAYYPPQQAQMLHEYTRRAFESGESFEYDLEARLPSGKHVYFEAKMRPIKDANGRVTKLFGTVQDITERKRSEEAMARQAEELDRLYRASGSLISQAPFDLYTLSYTIVNILQEEFGKANCSVFLIQENSNEIVRLATVGPYADLVKNVVLTLDGLGLVPEAMRSGQLKNTADVRSAPDYVPSWEAARSELTIPLKVGEQVIGAIDIQSEELKAFTADDERLMSIFAERAALTLEQARQNAKTERRMQTLASLRTIDLAITSSFDINLTLGVLLDQAVEMLKVDAADVLVFEPKAQTLRYASSRGFKVASRQHAILRLGNGYASKVIMERKLIIIRNPVRNTGKLQTPSEFEQEKFVTYIGAPLIAKGQVKGVLEIFQRTPLDLDKEQVAFLEMLSGQAAIAIDNAQLFDDLQGSNAELIMAYDETIEGWSHAMDLRDEDTEGHSQRVTELTMRLANNLGISPENFVNIRRGALLHDIGKIGVPDSILRKPSPLSEDEWRIMRQHPKLAHDMLAPIVYLRKAIDIPYCHHEKFDGTGYPQGLKGEEIPLSARVFAVVDVWDALTSDRPYRKAWSREDALAYIREQTGKHFDPKVVEAFLQLILT